MLLWIWLKRFDIKTGGVHREHLRVELSGTRHGLLLETEIWRDGSYMWFFVLFAERPSYLSNKFDLSKTSGLL